MLSGIAGQVACKIKLFVRTPLTGVPGTSGIYSALAPSVLGFEISPKPIKLAA